MPTNNQTKISDSKSYVFNINHFHQENVTGKSKHADKQQYLCAMTFDAWFAIRKIDPSTISWQLVHTMKMVMPVVNSFIQFNQNFQPIGLVIAYIDGSIQYSSWGDIQQNYSYEIQLGDSPHSNNKKSYEDILDQSKRSSYVNKISYHTEKQQAQTFMYENICFLYKKKNTIYSLNFKGQLKIYELKNKKIREKLNHQFQYHITCALNILCSSGEQVRIAICFQQSFAPFIFQLFPDSSSKTITKVFNQLRQKFIQEIDSRKTYNFKLITYDYQTETLVVSTDDNEFQLYSIDKENNLILSHLQFSSLLTKKQIKTQVMQQSLISDIDAKQGRLLILENNSYHNFDLNQRIVTLFDQKLKQNHNLHFGKIVKIYSQNMKSLLLIKKRFDYLDLNKKPSTTIHLFTGKLNKQER